MTELDKTTDTETNDDNEKLAGEIADKLIDNKTFKEACDGDVTQVDDFIASVAVNRPKRGC